MVGYDARVKVMPWCSVVNKSEWVTYSTLRFLPHLYGVHIDGPKCVFSCVVIPQSRMFCLVTILADSVVFHPGVEGIIRDVAV